MGLWNTLMGETEENQFVSRLHAKVNKLLPEIDENEHIKVACLAGLLARVAYIDFDVHPNELKESKNILEQWTNLQKESIEAVTALAIEEIKDLSGLENHRYCHPLNEILDRDERFAVLTALFALAASDGEATHNEVEEIRIISTGLKLSHKYFVSARATVKDKLGALK